MILLNQFKIKKCDKIFQVSNYIILTYFKRASRNFTIASRACCNCGKSFSDGSYMLAQ
jgi:hypothetical protein